MWNCNESITFGGDTIYEREWGILEAHWVSGTVTQAVLHEFEEG